MTTPRSSLNASGLKEDHSRLVNAPDNRAEGEDS
jgi:hypothetical protein